MLSGDCHMRQRRLAWWLDSPVMRNPRTLMAVALVIALPLLFAAAGGSRVAGILIGVVLIAGTLAWWAISARRG